MAVLKFRPLKKHKPAPCGLFCAWQKGASTPSATNSTRMEVHLELSQEYIKTALHYDPDTGVFRWRLKNGRPRQRSIAGSITPDGYRIIGLFHHFSRMKVMKNYPAHRLAVVYCGGELPVGAEVDHINGVRDDNRLTNLRVCTRTQNAQNSRHLSSRSKFKGVAVEKGCYRARITAAGTRTHIGYFRTAEEAAAAYDAVATKLHGEFACTNKDLGLL